MSEPLHLQVRRGLSRHILSSELAAFARAISAALRTAAPSFEHVKIVDVEPPREAWIRARESPGQARRESTTCYPGAHRQIGELGTVCEELASRLKVHADRVGCNLYTSSPGHGIPLHFDDHDVLVLQLEGSKRWTVGRHAALCAPASGYMLKTPPPRELLSYAWMLSPESVRRQAFARHTLAPGQAIYIPKGTWHATSAVSRSASVSFGFDLDTG